MRAQRYVHARLSKHIPVLARRAAYLRKQRTIHLTLAAGLLPGAAGMFLAALLLTSQFVPNPKYGINTLIGRHQSWIPAAEALPADTFTKVFVMPNMHYARGLGRALGLPREFRTAHGYRCDGLEGLLQRTLHVGQHDGFAANVDSGHALTSNPCHQGGIHQHCELQCLRVHGSNSMGILVLLHWHCHHLLPWRRPFPPAYALLRRGACTVE